MKVVAWQLPNRPEVIDLYHACWRIGAVAAPIHHLAGTAEVEAMAASVGADVILGESDVAPFLSNAANTPPVDCRSDDPGVILFTSGSEGVPKGVIHTRGALTYKGALMAQVHGLTAADVVLMPAPMAHISGLLNAVLLPDACGMRAVLMARWDPEEALRIIERERVSFMLGPPTFFVTLAGAPGFASERVRSIRIISCGGAGVTPDFVRSTAAAFDCVVKRTYGSTEAPTVTTAHAGDPPDRAAETDGRPVGTVELRIAEDGELLVRGPEVTRGYVDPAQTADAFVDGDWFRTGDRGVIDDAGWLTITGRIKDVIIRGGENIAISEVEALCEAHPAVRQAVAVGVPDERLGERVAVAVVVAPGELFDLATCRAWFEERGAARFKTPEIVAAVAEMPTLPAGKPDRAALRHRLSMDPS